MNIEPPKIVKKTGNEEFTFNGKPLSIKLKEFWSWSCSDLLNNAMRGVIAEFILTQVLEVESKCRVEWAAFDVETKRGLKIEVKSSSYLQSWKQDDSSQIKFGIQPTLAWNTKTNEYSTKKQRQSDLYVFCVLSEKEVCKVNPLKLEQWDFYILETSVLDKQLGEQKTIQLGSLLNLNPIKTDYLNLRKEIETLEEQIVLK